MSNDSENSVAAEPVATGVTNTIKNAAKSAADAVTKVGESIGDLNGDGVVDEKDKAVAKEQAGKIVDGGKVVVTKAWDYIKESQLAKDSAVGAVALGTVAAMLPMVTVPVGIAAGIGIAVVKWARRK
jgi:hypothetical protein